MKIKIEKVIKKRNKEGVVSKITRGVSHAAVDGRPMTLVLILCPIVLILCPIVLVLCPIVLVLCSPDNYDSCKECVCLQITFMLLLLLPLPLETLKTGSDILLCFTLLPFYHHTLFSFTRRVSK